MLDRAGAWFLNSGIQEPEGGVARYYRSDLGANARVSTEITGYAASFLAYAHRRTGDAAYLDAALRAARFLTRHAWDPALRLFPFEHSFQAAPPEHLAFFFDSGIIARGLLAVWRITDDRELLNAAIATGHGMIESFAGPHAIHPILELPARTARPYQPRWSAEPGCYQLKSAMAWHDLFEETGEAAFQDAYESALAQALANDPHFLPGTDAPEKVMDRLHAYSYFLEGVLPCADRPAIIDATRAGIPRAAAYLRDIAPRFERSDVNAQILRARLFADALGMLPLDAEAAAHEAEHAASFQFSTGGPRFEGGFGFGRKNGEELPYVNPVSTAFCAQALDMWCEHRQHRFKPDRKEIV